MNSLLEDILIIAGWGTLASLLGLNAYEVDKLLNHYIAGQKDAKKRNNAQHIKNIFDVISGFAQNEVARLSQVPNARGAEKRSQAITNLQSKLSEHGIDVTDQVLRGYIESAYQNLNQSTLPKTVKGQTSNYIQSTNPNQPKQPVVPSTRQNEPFDPYHQGGNQNV